MSPKLNKLAIAMFRIGLVPCALLGSQSIMAQTAPDKIEEIVITGSNIKRIEGEGPLPVLVVTRQELERSAAPSVGEYLRSLTVNSGGSNSESAPNNQSGAAGISLRGLGQKSTLILINGRRMANHAFSKGTQDTFVDINSIPKGAIERIEILKDGASAIYGSDAIAGVVNFILRKDYEGVTLNADVGRSTEKGLGEQNLSVSAGMGDLNKDKYNVLAIVDYFHRDRLLLSERKWMGDGDLSRYAGGANAFLSSSAGTYVFAPTLNGVARGAFANCLGNGYKYTTIPFAAPFFTSGTLCAHTTTPFITAYPEATRLGLTTRGTVAINPTTTAFAELSLAKNGSKWINQPQTLTNQTQVFDPTNFAGRSFSSNLPITNSSNPFGRIVGIRYTFFDVGARALKLDTDVYRVLGGFNGTNGGWDWDAAVSASQSKIKETTSNQVDANVLAAAIVNNTYNFLAPTQAQTDSLRISTQRNATSDLTQADAKASTTFGKLMGGPFGFAIGVDYRKEKMKDTPDNAVLQGRLLGTAASAISGSRSVTALYAELSAPLTSAFEMQFAIRGDKYSDFGNSSSPKIGAKWTVSKDLLVRASYSKGFRAPTLAENSQATSITFVQVAGAAANIIASLISTGNPNLKAEKSESSSIGMVWEPYANSSVSFDYYSITQNDLVANNGVNYILANQALFAADIVRDAAGGIVSIKDRFSNIAKVETRGYDIDVRLRMPGDQMPGKLTLKGSASYLASFKQPPTIGASLTEYSGTNAGPRGALPKTRGKLGFDWDLNNFAFSVSGNYIAPYKQGRTAAAPVPPADVFISGQSTADIFLSYKVMKGLKVSGVIQNVSDKQPSFDAASGFFDSTQYDLRGRYVRVGVEYIFR